MELAVIIVNWNGGDLLLRCLQSVHDSHTSFPVRVVVVDNNSSDGSRQQAAERFPNFTVVNSGANLGFGRANNFARSLVDSPLILFLNPDTELLTDTLETCVQALLRRPEVAALGCQMLYPDGTVQEQGLQWNPSPLTILLELTLTKSLRRLLRPCLPLIDPRQSSDVRKIYGGFVLARRQPLDQAGWFDDRYFMYVEDVDLSRTLRRLGHKLHYLADTRIVHHCGGTSEKAPSGFAVLMKCQSLGKYMRKYYGLPGLLAFRAVLTLGSLARLAATTPGLLLPAPAPRRHLRLGSFRKQQLTLLWALGLRQPSIAISPTPAPQP